MFLVDTNINSTTNRQYATFEKFRIVISRQGYPYHHITIRASSHVKSGSRNLCMALYSP
jgi:hypothetical protein